MATLAGMNVRAGGNLGEPALELLDPETRLYLLELSSFQLETTSSLAPHTAVVLNLSADHLDRYDGIQAYADTKARIYTKAENRVFNLDDPRVMAMQVGPGRDYYFTLSEPGDGVFGIRREGGASWLARGSDLLLEVSRLRIPGRHNAANALAALAMGTSLELPMPAMLESLCRFAGLPHRSQYVAEAGGVRWYNDSKGTNPGACAAALQGLRPEGREARIILIAGGDGKGADFTPLAPVVDAVARAVVLIGRDAPVIAKALEGTVPLLRAGDMDEAVRLAAGQAQPGDTVLLSPACASFDMYTNYAERGDAFMASVGGLIQ
jgi:UDP-N-acetylmuramoylalanine--D-glutamate ligase